MLAQVVRLKKGGEKLLLRGQSFYQRLNRNNRRYWKCSIKGCPATAITSALNGYVDVFKTTRHNHKVSIDSDSEGEVIDDSDEEPENVLWEEWEEHSSDDENDCAEDGEMNDEANENQLHQRVNPSEDTLGADTDHALKENEEADDSMSAEDAVETSDSDTDFGSDSSSTDDEEEAENSARILSKHKKVNKENIRRIKSYSGENYPWKFPRKTVHLEIKAYFLKSALKFKQIA